MRWRAKDPRMVLLVKLPRREGRRDDTARASRSSIQPVAGRNDLLLLDEAYRGARHGHSPGGGRSGSVATLACGGLRDSSGIPSPS
jgi:hypothetical protein